MITISAFADEISPDLNVQMDACEANGVRCIDVRGIDGINVSKMTLAQAGEYAARLRDRGFRVPCIGSPLGKIRMDEDFAAHLELLKHCAEVGAAFGTPRIRVFSFYPPAGRKIAEFRAQVMERMAAMAGAAAECGVTLYHENEKAIYGARPDGVKDIFAVVGHERLKGVFDPANFVEEGVRPYDDGWTKGLAELTDYMHIKDVVHGQSTCVPAGMGQGQLREIFADLKRRGYSGYMTLEPHMSKAGKFSGFTGPELFKAAADALKGLCDEAGIDYAKA
jgi:sugar phosphate isomerase/epimerase